MFNVYGNDNVWNNLLCTSMHICSCREQHTDHLLWRSHMKQTLDLFAMRWTSPPRRTGPILYTQQGAAVKTRAPRPCSVSTDVLAYERQPQKYILYHTFLYFSPCSWSFFIISSLLSMSQCNGTLYSRFCIISFLKFFFRGSIFCWYFLVVFYSLYPLICMRSSFFLLSPCLSPIPSTLSKHVLLSFHVDQEHKNMFFFLSVTLWMKYRSVARIL